MADTRFALPAVALGIVAATFITGAVVARAATPAAPPRAPEKIYASNCGYCHGHNIGPLIRGRALPPELVRFMVRHGRGAMPAFRPTEISDAELAALGAWIAASAADPKEHGQ